ncbi:YbjQ family protein [Sphingobacterium cavernae]|uniref:YbjQ family protein n=1 Tax=Sphingobacterium cavernae TaxID=2592657 RepID=UPI00122FEB26|nr:heavy metal-binding domain-containing protein [Sphingobacterium cavernae]
MIITTTNSIEGSTIKKYLDPITKNIVIGSNVLSDIGANFMDFFGGRVDTFEKKLSAIYLDVIEALKVEAKKRRANGLVGLSIDIDEISGGGKQMFMITATGTPVILSTIDNFELESNKTITGSYLSDKFMRKKY